MNDRESRLTLIVSACLVAFLSGAVGLAFVSDQVKDRVDRRVDQRVCRLVPTRCPPPPAPPNVRRGD